MKSLKMLLRFAIVGGLILLLLIPLMMIKGVISEREAYRDQAYLRVSQSRAGAQTLTGPIRVVPWTDTRQVEVVDAAGTKKVETQVEPGYWLQMPAKLVVDGGMQPDERRVGLFRVPVYTWTTKVSAAFNDDDYPVKAGRVYGTPYLAVGIADVRGLVGSPDLKVDGEALTLQPGIGDVSGIGKGLHVPLHGFDDTAGGVLKGTQVELSLVLDGTRSLAVVPVGDDSRIAIRSPWPHPLFGGSFLPNERKVDDKGFDAQWAVSSLASEAQRQLREGRDVAPETVSVELVNPVDIYTQADRASKYGILFIVLTFVGFILFELIKRLRIHPLQYLMVGLALAIFFLLLLSLSEHIPFWVAYVVSALACIGLQAVYLSGVLRSGVRGLGFAGMLTVLYGALYGLLVSENNALLMGSLLLFAVLATAMWITRRIDWYELGASLK
ncbi:cell envelope integrity protein CreD [Stenotrophomonas sp. ISL-67]|uniref:cell envelope integrity protein CreD n=1 Tax=Stenotrophomonas sp. ISL-67 TaxID=2819171 RepID=UPI001BE81D35|nr:cell envelope integrity protein CreD [Stenotrophomonas sp. ISL-67]MBT2766393.1 cell envelope integrity protein CreD [Stenotrophomonas sp. ISL-67]